MPRAGDRSDRDEAGRVKGMRQARGEAIVVGAGVVGITTAWALAESGWRVRILDRQGVALGTSLRNGGQLSYRYVAPLADAGVPLKALRWLLDPDGPLRWRPRAEPIQWRWLARFLAACNTRSNRHTAARLARLGQFSRECLHHWMRQHALDGFGWEQAGKLVLYRSTAALSRAAAACDSAQGVWTAAECLEREPALLELAGQVAGGIYSEDEAVADCHAFCESLMKRLEHHPGFAGFVHDRVRSLERGPAGLSVQGDAGRHGADAVVLAAGIASRVLAEPLGIRLPLYPLKGYSLDMPIGPDHRAPRASITDFDRKVLYARVAGRLRVAAMVDLVGHDDSIDRRRLASLLRVARADMPQAGDYAQAQPWAGLRPATPDGAPIVGPTAVRGLWLNVGHGALGFTFACGTAELLAAQMNGRELPQGLAGDGFVLKG